MHILLTDSLTCPRCGPGFGLILLADRMDDRRVVDGRLGCANCREAYPIAGGVADLRHETVAPLDLGPSESGREEDRAVRTAALLGVQVPSATLLVVESAGAESAEIASSHPASHLVGASAGAPPAQDETGEGTLSRVRIGSRLPFRTAVFQAAAVLGTPGPGLVSELHRVLVPGGRIVVDRAGADTIDRLRASGFTVHLEQDRIVVAAARTPG